MRRAYGLASKEGEVWDGIVLKVYITRHSVLCDAKVGSHDSVDSRQQQRQGEEEEEEEEEEGELEEKDVLDLYQWSQDLSFEELT